MSDGLAASGRVATPSVAGHRLTDLSAAVGAVAWVVAVAAGGLDAVERALALAPLVLVPLGVGMAATPPFAGLAGRAHRAAVALQPIGAAGVVLSLAVRADGATRAALAAPWLAVTGLLAVAAAARAVERGPYPLAETAVDAGLAYASVGATALVLFHLDVTVRFTRTIVELTAVHFHYAGFVLPVFAGLVGRCPVAADRRWFDALAAVVVAGPAFIAVGISFSPLVEVVAVGAFTAAVALLGGVVVLRVAPSRPRRQGRLLAAAALALPASMALALSYAVGTYTGTDPLGLSIPLMVRLHGSLNAFGFALGGLVGWRLAVPAVRGR